MGGDIESPGVEVKAIRLDDREPEGVLLGFGHFDAARRGVGRFARAGQVADEAREFVTQWREHRLDLAGFCVGFVLVEQCVIDLAARRHAEAFGLAA